MRSTFLILIVSIIFYGCGGDDRHQALAEQYEALEQASRLKDVEIEKLGAARLSLEQNILELREKLLRKEEEILELTQTQGAARNRVRQLQEEVENLKLQVRALSAGSSR